MRIDVLLASLFPNFSRSLIQDYIREKGVRIDGDFCKKPHFQVSETSSIKLDQKNIEEFSQRGKNDGYSATTHLKVLVDYKSFFAIDKSPGITSELIGSGNYLVHRLDKDTSGVLLLARTADLQAPLQKQWLKHVVEKKYIALVKGRVEPRRGGIDAAIARSIIDRKKMAVSARKGARLAYTEYKVLRYLYEHTMGEPLTLLEVYPKTGRTHQIRVHFASIGMPIIGDAVYGDRKINELMHSEYGVARQFLHASELKINNPATHKRITIKSDLPQDLRLVLDGLTSRRLSKKSH